MKSTIKRYTPKVIKLILNNIYYFVIDIIEFILNQRDSLMPPSRMRFDGPKDASSFKRNGEEFLNYYKELCALKPEEKILDVGCGIGRKTIPLTKYLHANGTYEGFDIIKQGVDWCEKNISSKYSQFHFKHVDIFNKEYNPTGKIDPSEFKFPYEDNYFDLVVLGSVFTHMLPADVSNYIKEVARVLKIGGRSLITYFLLDEEAIKLIDAKDSKAYSGRKLDFKYKRENYRTIDQSLPELAVAYELPFIVDLYKNNGLLIHNQIYYGSWCGRDKFMGNQDMIVSEKT